MVRPDPQSTSVASRAPDGGWNLEADLAMLHFRHLISGCCEYLLRCRSQQVLRTFVVEKAVQSRKPECQTPTVLGIPEDAEDFGDLFARTIIVVRIEPIQRKKIVSLVLDREDCPVPLPLVRLYAWIGSAVAGQLRNFTRGNEIATFQDRRSGIDEHARLRHRGLGGSHVGKQRAEDLFEVVLLALLYQLRQELNHAIEYDLCRYPLLIVRQAHGNRTLSGRAMQQLNDLPPCPGHHGWRSPLNLLDICHR